MMISQFAKWVVALVCSSAMLDVRAAENGGPGAPSFIEVLGVVRSNLTGISEAELNRAAVMGLLGQLQSRVTLITNGSVAIEPAGVPLLAKSTVLDGAYGFMRIGKVAPGLSNEIGTAYHQLRSTNQLKGLIVDLRFAVGQEYAAAAEAADLFIKTERPLLRWGEFSVRSTAKTNAIELPLVILINRDTYGAAEALAAALRQAEGALLLGSPSAGRAYLFKDFSLANSSTLRVANGFVAAGEGERLGDTGVMPDIRIAIDYEDEKAYFEDPYRVLAKPFAQSARSTNDLSLMTGTNRARRRLNEAELVRMQREGMDFETETIPSSSPQVTGPVVSDPALSRALDLLKGLALASKRR